MNKTTVEIINPIHQEDCKVGDIGYIDGYVQGGTGSPLAVVVIGKWIYLCPTHSLQVVSAKVSP